MSMSDKLFIRLVSSGFINYGRLATTGQNKYYFSCSAVSCTKCPLKEDPNLCDNHSDLLTLQQLDILKASNIELFI